MSTTLTFPSEFFTSTALNRLKKLRTMQFRPYRLTDAIIASKMDDAEGDTLVVPYDTKEHSKTTQHVTGYESIDLDIGTVLDPGTDGWFFCLSPVVWSWIDQEKQKGKSKIIGIVETRTENTDLRMRREFETQLLRGSVAAMSDLNSLNGADISTGFIEAVDAGTQSNTVHGVSKATFSSLPQFQNQFADIGGDFSLSGLAELRNIHTELQEITDDAVSLQGFASLEGAKNYGRAVQSQERYIDNRDAVRLDVVIAGLSYKISSLMPNSGTATGIADKEWSFLQIDTSVLKFHAFSGLVFDMTEFRDLGGAHMVKVAFHRLAGQMAIQGYGSQGVAIGGDTF